VSLFRDADPRRSESDEPVVGYEELGRATRTQTLAVGTLACARCDAPVAPVGVMGPADVLGCPFCLHIAPLREFLALDEPTRPARVVVRLVENGRGRSPAGLVFMRQD
jgi:hypothetical protein